jgi:hypothetical protein
LEKSNQAQAGIEHHEKEVAQLREYTNALVTVLGNAPDPTQGT